MQPCLGHISVSVVDEFYFRRKIRRSAATRFWLRATGPSGPERNQRIRLEVRRTTSQREVDEQTRRAPIASKRGCRRKSRTDRHDRDTVALTAGLGLELLLCPSCHAEPSASGSQDAFVAQLLIFSGMNRSRITDMAPANF